MGERRESGRRKSFLRGQVYYSSKHGALDCVVRDFSEEGARIVFSENVTLPDRIDLHIPQKNQTLRARVTWRRAGEIGLGFDADKTKAAAAAPLPDPAELMKRIAQLEGEIAKLQKMLRRMKAERPPHHEDDIVAA